MAGLADPPHIRTKGDPLIRTGLRSYKATQHLADRALYSEAA